MPLFGTQPTQYIQENKGKPSPHANIGEDKIKNFLHEVVRYFWIPLIVGLVSYVFFQLRDVLLGIVILVSLSALYTLVRLYFLHKKWWLIISLVAVILASAGFFFLRAPAITLSINGQKVTSTSVSFSTGSVSVNPAPESIGKYIKNTIVTLTANPAPGYNLKSWSGTDNDTSNPTVLMQLRVPCVILPLLNKVRGI